MTRLFAGRKSVGAILDDYRGAGPGFDLLRIGLAVSILLSHCSMMAGNHHLLSGLLDLFSHHHGAARASGQITAFSGHTDTGPARPLTLSRVPMFFALSGFLVSSSAFRTRNVLRFLGLRALRIFPALVVEVTLSAVLLGALFTTLPLGEYFTSGGFFRYFGNILGLVDMDLPGVFKTTSPSTAVNANLWTLPSEFDCYFLMSILMVSSIVFSRRIFTALFAVVTVGMIVANSFFGLYLEVLSGPVIVYYFMTGVLLYHWRDKLPYSWALLGVACVIYFVLAYFPRANFVYPVALTYITVFIGMTKLPDIPLIKTGDYSYGVYLYGYPITQGLIAGLPFIRGNLFLISSLSLLTTLLFAAFSWHAIEKHVLRLKKYVSPKSVPITRALHPDAAPALATGEAAATPGRKAAG